MSGDLIVWYQCGRKVAYPTWAAAEAVIPLLPPQRGRANGPEVYPCPHGEHYHLGHGLGVRRQEKQARRYLLRYPRPGSPSGDKR